MASVNDLIGKPVLDDGETKISDKSKKKEKEEVLEDFDLLGDEVTNFIEENNDEPTVETVRSIWLRVGGQTVNKRLEDMGTPVQDVIRFQQFRVIKSIVVAILPLVLVLVFKNWAIAGLSIFGFLIMWFMDYWKVAGAYRDFQFKRQLDFDKFIRMLMPYLMGTDVVLYRAFQKMKDRLKEGTTRTALITLITRMNSQPDSKEPYEEFAREASGQERSILIMQTLYDYQKSSNDSTTINELGKLVDEQLNQSIDEIIKRKDDQFETESYMLGFCILIPAMAYFLAIVVSMLAQFQSNIPQ